MLPQSTLVTFEEIPPWSLDCFWVSQPMTLVVRDPQVWASFWSLHWQCPDGSGTGAPPWQVDFRKNMAVGVFCGFYPIGCANYARLIEEVVRHPDHIEVRCRALDPRELGVCDMVTSPMQIVTIPQSLLPVIFTGDVPE